jgi:hypothetical protein
MTEDELTIDLPNVAALAIATWIYLIEKDEEARGIIAAIADKLEQSMKVTGEESEEEGTSGGEEHAEDSQG